MNKREGNRYVENPEDCFLPSFRVFSCFKGIAEWLRPKEEKSVLREKLAYDLERKNVWTLVVVICSLFIIFRQRTPASILYGG
ncbi:hypothetical protein GYMC52_2012 [Geobacillus sp. Y412MC52]|nr:hypothetical protein GYMC52_2012 [Geobacillus sp. Y412MC52]